MKKLILAITTVLMLASAPAMAQVFLDDDMPNNRGGELTENEFGVMVPSENVDYDQWKFSPVGEGLAILTGLGALYLLGKRNKKD